MSQPEALRITPTQEAEWRAQIRRALYVADPLPALAAQVHSQFEPEPGIVAERISYGTQYDMRVPAILYRPASPPAPRLPALIIVNGHGGDKYSWYPPYAGVLYARAGGVVLSYDPTGEGERNGEHRSGTREHDIVEPPDELGARMGGLMQTDLMQAVSYLSSRPDIDPARIAAAGYSMGSFVVAIAGAVDMRLAACALVGGGNLDGPGGIWERSKPMCQGHPYRALNFLGDRAAMLYALHASRGPTLIYNGTTDEVVTMETTDERFFRDLQQRVIALRGSAAGLFELGFLPDAGHRPQFVTKPVALWLHRQLRFPNWSEAEIEAMSETHISLWAATNGVEIDPLYATEHREGGTQALGVGIAPIKREMLNVYPLDEWERLKDQLVHEAWRVHARNAIGRS